jgi:MFS family permease
LVTRERAGVALLFLMNGFMIGAWAPKIPEFAARLGLGESSLGLMILTFGLGSIVMMPLAGSQIARFGSSRVSRFGAVLLTPTLLLLTVVGSIWTAAIAIFLFGGLIGAMDVAMNSNAVAVEKQIGVGPHAVIVTMAAAVMVAACWPLVLRDAPHPAERAAAKKAGLPLSPLPWLIGIMALFCMVPEGAVLDWGALYLRNELSASVTLSGFAFAAFSLAMSVMRFAGDVIRDRFGAVTTLRACAVVAIAGLLLAGFAPTASVAIIGFALAGVGISNLVPIAFSAAGNLPGIASGVGLSVVTTMGYSGILVAPSAVGFVAEHTGLAPVFIGLSTLILVALVLSPLARHADGAHEAPAD